MKYVHQTRKGRERFEAEVDRLGLPIDERYSCNFVGKFSGRMPEERASERRS